MDEVSRLPGTQGDRQEREVSDVIPFISRAELEQDRLDAEERTWMRRLAAGDSAAMTWWMNHEAELPFGVKKRYGDLTRPELKLLVEMDKRKEKEAVAELDWAIDEMEARADAGDPEAVALWNSPEYVQIRAERDARRKGA
jgi:hypothetical protein